jgi:NADPH2:quinone reductase
MKNARIIVTRYGGPDALQVVEEACPEPKHGEVRVRVQAAGVSLPDIMARQGIHPETPRVPFTPGWDLVGVVDRLGDGTSGIEPGQIVAAMPIHGAYAEFVCLPQRELVPVPPGLDAAEAVSLILNYVTAYQMLHRSAKVRPGQRVLIHGAAGGVGSALLQLGRLAALEMYGTCSSRGEQAVSELGAIPIDYKDQDFAKEIYRLRLRAWMASLTQSAVPTSGIPARLSVLAERWWLMAILPRCVARDWLQVVRVVGIAYMESPFMRCISSAAGFCRATNA